MHHTIWSMMLVRTLLSLFYVKLVQLLCSVHLLCEMLYIVHVYQSHNLVTAFISLTRIECSPNICKEHQRTRSRGEGGDFYMLQPDNKFDRMCHKVAIKVCSSSSIHIMMSIEKRQDPTLTKKAASQLKVCICSACNHC